MLRKLLVLVVGFGLSGCGSSGPSIAGTWDSTFRGATLTLTANPDSSFSIQGTTQLTGKWESSGDEVRLFRDIKNGGDVNFGDGGDGAIHLKFSKDGKHLDGKTNDGTPFAFIKK